MKLSAKDGLNARNLFHKHFMVLLGLLAKPFEYNKQNQIVEVIEILTKLLLVIEKTHVQISENLYDDRVLSGILNFVPVRYISREFDIKDVVKKYETTLNSIKTLSNLFYSKDLSFHQAIAMLKQYTSGYNNILSRSALMFNLSFLIGKTEKEFKDFFAPYLKNEVLLYIPASMHSMITPSVIDNVLETTYTVFYDGITKLAFDKEKQYINIQRVLKELGILIKLLVN